MRLVILILAAAVLAIGAWAHGGGLNAAGCHNNRKTRDYHCHRNGYSPSASSGYSSRSPAPSSGAAAFVNNNRAGPVSSEKVLSAQLLLKRGGCGVSEADGVFGPETRSAVERFQRSQRLLVTGLVDDRLISDLVRLVDEAVICG